MQAWTITYCNTRSKRPLDATGSNFQCSCLSNPTCQLFIPKINKAIRISPLRCQKIFNLSASPNIITSYPDIPSVSFFLSVYIWEGSTYLQFPDVHMSSHFFFSVFNQSLYKKLCHFFFCHFIPLYLFTGFYSKAHTYEQ